MQQMSSDHFNIFTYIIYAFRLNSLINKCERKCFRFNFQQFEKYQTEYTDPYRWHTGLQDISFSVCLSFIYLRFMFRRNDLKIWSFRICFELNGNAIDLLWEYDFIMTEQPPNS